MDFIRSAETSEPIYQTTPCNVPQENNICSDEGILHSIWF